MSTTRTYSLLVVGLIALAAIAGCTREVTTVVQDTPQPLSCFECHSDEDTHLVRIERQWSNSVHASGNTTGRNTPPCSGCHTSEGFVQRANGEEATLAPEATMIHCFTCHAPHTTLDASFPVRISSPQTLATGVVLDVGLGNLCAFCHQGRGTFEDEYDGGISSTHWGAHHGPQADMLAGTNGYEYDGYTYGDTPGHRNATDDGCVDCHMRNEDGSHGNNQWLVGGHSFNMAYGEGAEELFATESCARCHTTMSDFDFHGVQTEVDSLTTVLHGLLETAGLVSASGSPKVVTTSADSAGAVWNYRLVVEDRSEGVHNADYIRSLLHSTIDFMNPPTK